MTSDPAPTTLEEAESEAYLKKIEFAMKFSTLLTTLCANYEILLLKVIKRIF